MFLFHHRVLFRAPLTDPRLEPPRPVRVDDQHRDVPVPLGPDQPADRVVDVRRLQRVAAREPGGRGARDRDAGVQVAERVAAAPVIGVRERQAAAPEARADRKRLSDDDVRSALS